MAAFDVNYGAKVFDPESVVVVQSGRRLGKTAAMQKATEDYIRHAPVGGVLMLPTKKDADFWRDVANVDHGRRDMKFLGFDNISTVSVDKEVNDVQAYSHGSGQFVQTKPIIINHHVKIRDLDQQAIDLNMSDIPSQTREAIMKVMAQRIDDTIMDSLYGRSPSPHQPTQAEKEQAELEESPAWGMF